MRHIYFFVIFFFCISNINAQTKAITDNGDQVILYQNGTWKYIDEFKNKDSIIQTNPTLYIKPDSATFLIKSKINHLGVYINPSIWTFKKAVANANAEYELEQKNGANIQAIIINEKISLSLEALKNIVVKNARENFPDYHILKEEFRTVNGLRLLYTESVGTISEIKFRFFGYYYSDSTSTLQFLVIVANDIDNKERKEITDLLNGTVVVINQPGTNN